MCNFHIIRLVALLFYKLTDFMNLYIYIIYKITVHNKNKNLYFNKIILVGLE